MAASSQPSGARRWRKSSATCSGTSRNCRPSSSSTSTRSRSRTSRSSSHARSAGSSPVAATTADERGRLRAARRDDETLEAPREALGHERVDADAVGRVLAADLAGDLVQLGETAAVLVRDEQVEAAQRVRELVLDALAELLETFPRLA